MAQKNRKKLNILSALFQQNTKIKHNKRPQNTDLGGTWINEALQRHLLAVPWHCMLVGLEVRDSNPNFTGCELHALCHLFFPLTNFYRPRWFFLFRFTLCFPPSSPGPAPGKSRECVHACTPFTFCKHFVKLINGPEISTSRRCPGTTSLLLSPLSAAATCCLVTKPCLTLCYPRNYSLSVSSIHGIFQARIVE